MSKRTLACITTGAIILSLAGCSDGKAVTTTDPLMTAAENEQLNERPNEQTEKAVEEPTKTEDGNIFTDLAAVSEWKHEKSSIVFGAHSEDTELGGKLSIVNGKTALSFTIDELFAKVYGQDIRFTDIEVITDGKSICVGTNLITQLGSTLGDGTDYSVLIGDAKYLSVPVEEVGSMITGSTDVDMAIASTPSNKSAKEEMEDKAKLITAAVLPEISASFKAVEADFIGTEDGVHTLILSDKNADKLLKVIEEMIDSGRLKKMLNAISVLTKTSYTAEDYENTISDLREAIEDTKEELERGNTKFEFKVQTAVDGEFANISLDGNFSSVQTMTDYDRYYETFAAEDEAEAYDFMPTKEVTVEWEISVKAECEKFDGNVEMPAANEVVTYDEIMSKYNDFDIDEDFDYESYIDDVDYDSFPGLGGSDSYYESYTVDNGDGTFTTHSHGEGTSMSASASEGQGAFSTSASSYGWSTTTSDGEGRSHTEGQSISKGFTH